MLDIHASNSQLAETKPIFEILEAGTGHEALTMHLAKAIHAANPSRLCQHFPTEPVDEECGLLSSSKRPDSGNEHTNGTISLTSPLKRDDLDLTSESPHEYDTYQRQAIIHTLDASPIHSKHAKQIVKGFRQGLYVNDIDFHVGDISQWIDRQIVDRKLAWNETSFLSHVVLDMPSANLHVEKAASALHVNGNLLVFNPSVTQIMSVVDMIKRLYLPLQLDRVLELGPTMTSGREWDVRLLRPRALIRAENFEKSEPVDEQDLEDTTKSTADFDTVSKGPEAELGDVGDAREHTREDRGWEMVCKPKVGYSMHPLSHIFPFRTLF